ncbi:hypothetical protein FisN_1Lh693 [Fistulifera solaris]|uniref:Uncharacterized protein n=1 Tax=Fistulifera solaris TaxID=1519565 RepID=A0A1Z5K1F3_FISSO|nr:hypothetical protein FisN_1Lh693 [Fistulifera solaris]|eukprot:GAX19851.1 hypothetical protein FisN_1Lh693 [Fistulifera solaris]
MSEPVSTDEADNNNSFNKDFVIRDGFPALRRQDGSHWIEGDEPIPRQPFLAFEHALNFSNIDDWRHDCEIVFTARDKEENVSYSAGVTYFMPSVMKPRCAIEAFVLDLFHRHVTDKTLYLPEQSGAEWWTLVMDESEENEKEDDNEDEDDDEQGDEVGMHFDADYGLEEQAPNLLVHPRIATVTYLSDSGAPTVVFNKKSPPPTNIDSLGGEIRTAWLSQPSVGKHIAFDGRLLHGAPATFFPAMQGQHSCELEEPPNKKVKSEPNKKRYTILVNIWLNHCPLDAEPLDDDIIQQLKVPCAEGKSPSFSWNCSFDATSLPQKVALTASTEDPAGEEETVICGRRVNIVYGATMDRLYKVATSGRLLELELGEGAVSIQVGEAVLEESDEENDE